MPIANQIARLILTLILAVLLVGFGACGAMGALGGLGNLVNSTGISGGLFLLALGLVGLAIACVCGVAIYKLWRQRPPFDR